MSFDLFFLRRPGEAPPSNDELKEYFAARANYQVDGTQFFYENQDTGVYFVFEYSDPSESRNPVEIDEEDFHDPDDGLVDTGLSLNVNYFRPHFFGLEVEKELTELVGHFSLLVDDPQREGMGRGEYTPDGLLRSWNAGNEFGHYAYLSQMSQGEKPIAPGSIHSLPKLDLERYWTWNYFRNTLQENIDVDAYVSIVRLINVQGKPSSFVVWGDGIPEAFPEVDYLFLVRDQLGPRSFFKKRKDCCLVPFRAAQSILQRAQKRDEPVPHYLFAHNEPPRDIVDFYKKQKSFDGELEGLAWDQVLTRELVDAVASRVKGD